MGTGLLIANRRVLVPGLTVVNRFDESWCALETRDFRMRRGKPGQLPWVRQVILHGTTGDVGAVKLGAGPGGHAKATADFWRSDPAQSGAHLVVDNDGKVYCLADLMYACAFHATVSNEWSVGIEMAQEQDNGIYEAVYQSMVILVPFICQALGIPFSVCADPYTGHPLSRFLDGGPTVAGVYGHRENTEQRGRGDPGDEIYARLKAAGGTPVRFQAHEDISLGKRRQAALNARGEHLAVDGICGPTSIAAMRRHGFATWNDVT